MRNSFHCTDDSSCFSGEPSFTLIPRSNGTPLFLIGNESTNGGLSLAMLVYQSVCNNIDPQYDPVVLPYGMPILAH